MNLKIFITLIVCYIASHFNTQAHEQRPLIIYCRDAFAHTWGQLLQKKLW